MKILILVACISASLLAHEFDPENMYEGEKAQLPKGGAGRARVMQILGKSGMLVSIEKKGAGDYYLPSATVAVKGLETVGLVDGKELILGNWFEVSGTMQYKTVLGATKTIYVLTSCEDPTAEQRRQELAEKEKIEQATKAEEAAKAARIAKAKLEEASKKFTLFSLADGKYIWAQRDNDLGDSWLTQDSNGNWRTVKKTDVLSIKRPE